MVCLVISIIGWGIAFTSFYFILKEQGTPDEWQFMANYALAFYLSIAAGIIQIFNVIYGVLHLIADYKRRGLCICGLLLSVLCLIPLVIMFWLMIFN